MKSFIAVFLSILILFTGCSSTYHLTHQEIKKEIEGENVLIKLKSGEEIKGKIIEIGVDSTFNKNLMLKEVIVIPTSEVKEIHLVNHGEGLVDGLLVGAGIGFVGGAAFGIALVGKPFIRGEFDWRIIPVTGGIAGIGCGILGMPIGAIIGHKYINVIDSSLPNEYIKIELSELPKITSQESPEPKIVSPEKIIEPTEFVILEVTSILEENEYSVSVLWKGKEIQLSKYEIKEMNMKENSVIIKIPKDVYLKKFR